MGLYTASNLPKDGEGIDAADVNTDLQGLIDEFNGKTDNDNIAAGAGIETYKLANSYRAKAHQTGAGQSVGSGDWATVTLDTEDYDPNSNFASNTYTVPVSGVYLITASVAVAKLTDTKYIKARIYISTGATSSSSSMGYAGESINNISVSFLGNLSANDTVILQVYHDEGSNKTLSNTELANYLAVQLLTAT